MRILFVNVFIVSLFSYIALFFVLPTAIWTRIRGAILTLFPFNGTAYPYEALVCGKQIFAVKPALKDVWAFNVSLLAVRSKYFSNTSAKYQDLPCIDLKNSMLIKHHRDAAAVDFWRSRHLPDGTLVPPSPPTSSEAYKILVEDVYLDGAVTHCNGKLGRFLQKSFGPSPPPSPHSQPSQTSTLFSEVSSSLQKLSHAPQKLLLFQMALVSNALPTLRRRRHQDKISVSKVDRCFFCGSGQDSIVHLFSYCPVVSAARNTFLAQLGLKIASHPSLLFCDVSESNQLEETKEEKKQERKGKGESDDEGEEGEGEECVRERKEAFSFSLSSALPPPLPHHPTPPLSLSSSPPLLSPTSIRHTKQNSYSPVSIKKYFNVISSTTFTTRAPLPVPSAPPPRADPLPFVSNLPPNSLHLHLLTSCLYRVPDELLTPLLAFNLAVWQYRQPAQASRIRQTEQWLINRVCENAQLNFLSIKPKGKKKRKVIDSESESKVHNERVMAMESNTAICYSDGSASPNPGPCGAGVSIFLRDPDLVFDHGASVGRGTNIVAELYGLGIIFSQLILLSRTHPRVKKAIVFCDSKIALRAATSRNLPRTNGDITKAVRAKFLAVSKFVSIDLQWIRGHVNYGGNERVDRISKLFARTSLNNVSREFSGIFFCQSSCLEWVASYPLTGLPISVFITNLIKPTGDLHVIEPQSAQICTGTELSESRHIQQTNPPVSEVLDGRLRTRKRVRPIVVGF